MLMFGANSDWFSCERKFSHKLPTKHKIHKKFSTTKIPTSRHPYKANANLPLHKTGLKCCTAYMDTGSFFYIQTLIHVWSLCLYNWKWEHTSSAFSSSPCVSRKEITLSPFSFSFSSSSENSGSNSSTSTSYLGVCAHVGMNSWTPVH